MYVGLGALGLNGWSRFWRDRDTTDLMRAQYKAAGFQAIASNGVRRILDKVYKECREANPRETPTLSTSYGWAFKWYREEHGQSVWLSAEVYGHASGLFRIDPHTPQTKSAPLPPEILARIRETGERSATLSAIGRASGVHPMKVRFLAAAYGLMRHEKITGTPVLIASDVARVLEFMVSRLMTRKEASAVFGVDARAMAELEAHGSLTPVRKAGREATRKRPT